MQTNHEYYHLDGNQLVLKVKRAPIALLIFYYFVGAVLFLMPIVGQLLRILDGKGLHIGFVFGGIISYLLSFFMLKMALWNTKGSEILQFEHNTLTYIADYGLFKAKERVYENAQTLQFDSEIIGYEEDRMRLLIIGTPDEDIKCVTKIPEMQMNELLIELSKRFSN